MFSRSLFIRIDKIGINSIQEAINIKEYIEVCICYIIKKILIDNNYSIVISYNYDTYKVSNAFTNVEQVNIDIELYENIMSLSSMIIKNLEQIIHETYIANMQNKIVLNINSMLVNCDSLLVTYEIFEN